MYSEHSLATHKMIEWWSVLKIGIPSRFQVNNENFIQQ